MTEWAFGWAYDLSFSMAVFCIAATIEWWQGIPVFSQSNLPLVAGCLFMVGHARGYRLGTAAAMKRQVSS